MDYKDLPKGCQLCFSLQDKDSEPKDMPNYSNFGDFQACQFENTTCLPKDRAMLLLLHRLNKKLEKMNNENN